MNEFDIHLARELVARLQNMAVDIARDSRGCAPQLSLDAQTAAVHARGLLAFIDLLDDLPCDEDPS